MNPLHKIALVGTAKQPVLPNVGGMLAALLPETSDAEEQLLLYAGSLALYEQAGFRPSTSSSPLNHGPESSRALRSSRLTHFLQQALVSGNRELLREFLATLEQEQLELPYEVLPQALEQTDREVRQWLTPVLGERGRWLSKFNPRWQWATQGVSVITVEDRTALRRAWDEGKLAQRILALTVMRQADAAEARRWLSEALPKEKADVRAQLVDTLQHHLSMSDEPLLDTLRHDRSEAVRQLATTLLRQLPESALALRFRQRAESILTLKNNALGLKLLTHAPEELPSEWLADGFPGKPPPGVGKKAYWVESLMSAVPTTHWSQYFSVKPEQLIISLAGDEFAGEVIHGWTRALQVYHDATAATLQWTHALWGHWLSRWQHDKKQNQATLNSMLALLKLLPPQTAEQNVLPFLVPGRLSSEALLLMVEVLPRPWSAHFALNYMKVAREHLRTGYIDAAYEWAKTLEIASRAVPRSTFAQALAPWNTSRPDATSWTAKALDQLLDGFLDVVKLRQLFHEELRK
jgi:hypothetical protein